MDALGGMIGQTLQHVGEPGSWINVVNPTGLDQRLHRRRAVTPGVGTRECPGLPADRDTA
jgi:hypothetical protein